MAIADPQPAALLPAWAATTVTQDGVNLNLRPACAEDEPKLADFLRQLNPQDLRFRFLSATKGASPGLAHALADIDHDAIKPFGPPVKKLPSIASPLATVT